MHIPSHLSGEEAIEFIYLNLSDEKRQRIVARLNGKLLHKRGLEPTPPSDTACPFQSDDALNRPQSQYAQSQGLLKSQAKSLHRMQPISVGDSNTTSTAFESSTAKETKPTRRVQPTIVATSNETHAVSRPSFGQSENDGYNGIDCLHGDDKFSGAVPDSESGSDSDSGFSIELEYAPLTSDPRKQRLAYKTLLEEYRKLKLFGPPTESGKPKSLRRVRPASLSEVQQESLGWEFLGNWRSEEDILLPPVNEWEIESDDSATFLEELGEVSEDDTTSKYLSKEEASRVVDEVIEDQIQAWRMKKLPLRRTRACGLWREYPNASVRYQFAHVAKERAEGLGQRLGSLKKTILDEQWRKESRLQQQCKSLELTVFQREDWFWKAEVLKSSSEPAAVKKIPRSRKKVASAHGSDSEGIDLDSEEEVASTQGDDEDSTDYMDVDYMDVDQPEELDMTEWLDSDDEELVIIELSSDDESAVSKPSSTNARGLKLELDPDLIAKVVSKHESEGEFKASPKPETPHKKRKRTVQTSQQAKRHQSDAKRRAQENEERARQNLSELEESQGLMMDADGDKRPVINPGKEDEHNYIYINALAGNMMLPHQLEGVQFLWREIVVGMSGCLLSHTMGLGKSMQMITLLVTIAEASASKDNATRRQIPERLRKSRALVLCPASLVQNWKREFEKWTPSSAKPLLGKVTSITADVAPAGRLESLLNWSTIGGVLIMSYNLFVKLVDGEKFDAVEQQQIKDALLDNPNIIVADEAHTLKNSSAKVTVAASKFRSRSRIALTGSPLSNSLREYYSMINWVSPAYLGKEVEFRARFEEPIYEGSYLESTSHERRKATVRLKALERVLEPKVHRRDGAVLKSTLLPKVEWEIKVQLSDAQREQYNEYIDLFFPDIDDQSTISNTGMWAHKHYLILLCGHPGAMRKKLKATLAEEMKKTSESAEASSTPNPSSAMMTIPKLERLLLSVSGGHYDASLSNKTKGFLEIVKGAIAVGDKTLVFSQTLDTLFYLGVILSKADIKFSNLDGHVAMEDRQKMIDNFNGSENNTAVFLISTRAGGQGVNIQGANRVIIFDFGFNPAWDEQAIGRAYRMGQEKPVYVYKFVADGTIETAIQNVTTFKTQLAIRVLEKKNTESVAMKTKDFLHKPKDVEAAQDEELSQFRKADAVLDRILDVHSESPFITSISTTDIYRREREEDLTAEDRKEIEELVEREQKGDRGVNDGTKLTIKLTNFRDPILPGSVPRTAGEASVSAKAVESAQVKAYVTARHLPSSTAPTTSAMAPTAPTVQSGARSYGLTAESQRRLEESRQRLILPPSSAPITQSVTLLGAAVAGAAAISSEQADRQKQLLEETRSRLLYGPSNASKGRVVANVVTHTADSHNTKEIGQ